MQVVDFYEFYEGLQEGWDGPALLVFSDGKRVGARLDRNGLRPARFWRTADDTIYVASEVWLLCTCVWKSCTITLEHFVEAAGQTGALQALMQLQGGGRSAACYISVQGGTFVAQPCVSCSEDVASL
jgi:hypothetical protein